MKTPLADVVRAHRDHISFHTPAHSGVLSLDDITELSYSGDLVSQEGAVAESEALVSEAYGAEATLFITNGATMANHIAMSLFRGKRFLVLGAAHRSVFSGLRLFAGDAFYLSDGSKLGETLAFLCPAALVVTSPDYFGHTLDLRAIRGLCDRFGTALLIDAAHGSHFAFCSIMPESATKYGDLVTHSLHKTMPALTGAALLHCKKEYYQRAVFALGELHSSSPSYPVMLSIESAVAQMAERGERLWQETAEEARKFAAALPKPYEVLTSDDPTRITVVSPYPGNAVVALLEERGIYPEMSYGNRVVLIATPYNARHLATVAEALAAIRPQTSAAQTVQPPVFTEPVPLLLGGEGEWVPVKQSAGRTLLREVGFYPPGVPFFLPGRGLTGDDAAILALLGKNVFGIDNGCVFVVL